MATIFYVGYYFLKSRAIKEIIFQYDQASQLIGANQQKITGYLRGDSTITRWVSVLRFAIPEKYFSISVVVFQDAIPPEEYRKLLRYCRVIS